MKLSSSAQRAALALGFLVGSFAAEPALAKAPVVQAGHTLGLEIEGMLSATLVDGALSEKAYHVQNSTKSFELDAVRYELDQIDRAKARVATVEIVTAPYAASATGIAELLGVVRGAFKDAPTGEVAFSPSVDFGGHESKVKISKGKAAGSVQTNLTVPAGNLFPETDAAAATYWSNLVPATYVKKIVPLVAGARDLADLLAKEEAAPLHELYAAKKNRLRLWMFLHLSRLAYTIGGDKLKVAGFYKDHHGYTVKMFMDPVSSGLPAEAGATLLSLEGGSETQQTLHKKIIARAIDAVAKSLGKTVRQLTPHWPAASLQLATKEKSVASERALAARIVGGVLSPILELRRSNSSVNSALRAAIAKAAFAKNGDAAAAAAVAWETVAKVYGATAAARSARRPPAAASARKPATRPSPKQPMRSRVAPRQRATSTPETAR